MNHGGGYQYRVCEKAAPQTESCFAANPLEFISDNHMVEFPNSGRTIEIPATDTDVVEEVTTTWRRIPLPACNW